MGPALIIFVFQVTIEKIYSVQKLTLKPITARLIFRFLRSTLKPNIAGRFPPELVYIGSDS